MSNITNSSQARSLWMGDIETWMNEDFIKEVFKDYGIIKLFTLINPNSFFRN